MHQTVEPVSKCTCPHYCEDFGGDEVCYVVVTLRCPVHGSGEGKAPPPLMGDAWINELLGGSL